MTHSNVSVFETTIQKTHLWLEEIKTEMGWQDHEKAYRGLRAVLHALRDRLDPNEAVHLAAQLPMLVRGFYFEGWHLANKPLKYRHKQEFFDRVRKEAPSITKDEVELAVTVVFHRLSTEMPSGEIEQVRGQLPSEMQELWLQSGL